MNDVLNTTTGQHLSAYAIERLGEIKEFDTELYGHCIRVANLASAICIVLKKDKVIVQDLWLAGALHDYGKMFIDKRILNKPGRLTKREFNAMKMHVLLGVRVLETDQRLPKYCLQGILEHHERKLGIGYPFGKTEISEYGEILAACDVYDALTTKRVYKEAMSRKKALKIIREEEDFREEIVDALEDASIELDSSGMCETDDSLCS